MMEIHELPAVAPGSGFFICSRIKSRTGAWAVQADVSEIAVRIVLESLPGVDVATDAPAVSSVIFDTLQLDDRWGGKDKLGYNACYATLANQTPLPGKTYLIMFRFTPPSGAPFYEYFRVSTIKPAFNA